MAHIHSDSSSPLEISTRIRLRSDRWTERHEWWPCWIRHCLLYNTRIHNRDLDQRRWSQEIARLAYVQKCHMTISFNVEGSNWISRRSDATFIHLDINVQDRPWPNSFTSLPLLQNWWISLLYKPVPLFAKSFKYVNWFWFTQLMAVSNVSINLNF